MHTHTHIYKYRYIYIYTHMLARIYGIRNPNAMVIFLGIIGVDIKMRFRVQDLGKG